MSLNWLVGLNWDNGGGLDVRWDDRGGVVVRWDRGGVDVAGGRGDSALSWAVGDSWCAAGDGDNISDIESRSSGDDRGHEGSGDE